MAPAATLGQDAAHDDSAHRVEKTGVPYLRIEEMLSKRFGSFEALRDISLEIAWQEFVCFLGPSGCGKTTLLRAIAGLDNPVKWENRAGRGRHIRPAAHRARLRDRSFSPMRSFRI